MEFDWDNPGKDGSVDMLVTDGALIFSPSPDKSFLKKTSLGIQKHGVGVGMVLGGAGALGVAAGALVGAAVETVAGVTNKKKTSSSDLEKLRERFLLGQAICCLRKNITVKIYAVKKSFFKATQYHIFVEGIINFTGLEPRDAAIMLITSEISFPRDSLISSGYAGEGNHIKCSEEDFVMQVREKYPYRNSHFEKLMTYEERLKFFRELIVVMEQERKAEKNGSS